MTGPRRTAYDAVVVGSGPGGASVARALARAGQQALVVERGGDAEPSASVRRQVADLFVPGRSLHLTRGPVLVLAAATLGGSSMYWFGSVDPPPASVFGPVGVDLSADTAALLAELAPAPVPRDLFGPRAALLLDAAQSLGLDWRPLPKLADADVLRAQGPAGWRQARWTARRFVADAVAAGAEVLLRAAAVRVLHRSGRVTGVELRVGGRLLEVAAGLVVLAAGGLGTPVVLRRSGFPEAGFDFFDDPVMTVSGTVAGLDAGMEPPMLGALDRIDADGYLLTDLTRPRWLHTVLTTAAGRPDRAPAYRRTVSVMVKTRDGLSGRITDRGRVAKPLTPSDRAIFASALPEAEAVVRAAGGRGLFRAGHVAVHPGGTAKIGEVVDSDLQTRVHGLYVCDASVIPTAWGRPPTFTVLALARRLGRHLTGGASASGLAADKDVPDPG